MPYFLHIETATDICSVAISENDNLLAQCESNEPNKHSSQLTLLIQEVVKTANLTMKDLNAVALSSGPGSYTSLRVGSSVAKGICYALNIPLISVDTLQSIASGTFELVKDPEALYCAMIDARRMEVYVAIYDAQMNLVKDLEARIINEEYRNELIALNKKIIFSGNGAEKCKDILEESNFTFLNTICKSSNMLKLAYQKFIHFNFEDIAYFSPEYLKAPNISESKKVL